MWLATMVLLIHTERLARASSDCFAQYSETREEFPKSPDVSGLSIVDMKYPYPAVHFALIEFGQQRRRNIGTVPVVRPGGSLFQYSQFDYK
jgi:hypothetical protein